MKTLPLTISLILLLLCSVALAVDPETAPQEGTPAPIERDQPEGSPLPFPEQMIVGEVTGSDGNAIAGATVKLFANGNLVEVAHTTAAGDYEIRLPLQIDDDETVVLWFIDNAGNYPPQEVLLKESSRAKSAGLFSKCTQEIKMRPQTRVDVRMMTVAEQAAAYTTKGCL
jgi:hypothetical protein